MRGTRLLSLLSAGNTKAWAGQQRIGRWKKQLAERMPCLSPLIQELGRPIGWRSISSTPFSSAVIVNHHTASEHDPNKIHSPTMLNNPDHSEVTQLVDGLLAHTRALMEQPLLSGAVEEENDTYMRHIVAFSGGIDSTLVLALLVEASKLVSMESTTTSTKRQSVHAIIGISPAVSQDQLTLAQRVTDHIGIPLVQVETTEGNDETYIANTGQACLACKTHLYSALEAIAEHAIVEDALLVSSNNNKQQQVQAAGHTISLPTIIYRHQLYNGTNADDIQDSTRVGLIAARNFHVQSPLIYTSKYNVRRVAKHLGLPNWNTAASPCLRSRLALGVAATQQHLQRIEAAELFVRQQLVGIISETSNLRVRLMAGNRAMLEIDAELLPHVTALLISSTSSSSPLNNNNNNSMMTSRWESHFVQTLGFTTFDVRAFQSGSVARTNGSGQQKTIISTGAAMHSLQEAVA
jgi:pyridinium-3,5-biscarboxylic acid mononucleotide sulfurtransferase